MLNLLIPAISCLLVGVMLVYMERDRAQRITQSCVMCGAGRHDKHHQDCPWK